MQQRSLSFANCSRSKSRLLYSTVIIALLAVPAVLSLQIADPNYKQSNALHGSSNLSPLRPDPSSVRPPSTGKGVVLSKAVKLGSTPPAVNWDEQLGLTISQEEEMLQYNVTAVEQADSNGYGPAYLLNGLTDKGDWYQVGLAFDWPLAGGGYQPGFSFLYETFNSTGSSVFPSDGGGGLANYSGAVDPGDEVLLRLNFTQNVVVMYSKDWNTGAAASINYTSFDGAIFEGLQTANNPNGYFSGLMTEDYHVLPYLGQEAQVTYSNSYLGLDSATMWIDEYNPSTNQTLFGGATPDIPYTNPNELLSYSLNGTSEESDAYEFMTGSNVLVPITLSYQIAGEGSNYLAPMLSYVSNGVPENATLTSQAATYYMDKGTTWSVTDPLNGSSSTERWISNTSNGTVSSAQTIVLNYTHEFFLNFAVSPIGSGSIYPSVSGWYPAEVALNFTATPKAPYLFSSWLSTSADIQFASFTTANTTAIIEGSGNVTGKFSTVALSLSAYSEMVTQGSSVSNRALIMGPNESVSLSITGLPSGAAATWSSEVLSAQLTGTPDNFTVNTSYETTPGVYNVTITASSVNGSSSILFTLTVGTADPLTVSYSLNDGSIISSPVLAYVYNGTFHSANLTLVPQTIYMDNGSSWSISFSQNATSTQRWITNSPATGMATGPATIEINYFHQYQVGFTFGTANNSTVPGNSPSVTVTSEGASAVVYANGSMTWVDSGSPYNFSRSLILSPVDRLEVSDGPSGTITQPGIMNATYIQEYLVIAMYSISENSGSALNPSLTIIGSNSTKSSLALTANGTAYWIASGSTWTATQNFTTSSVQRYLGKSTSGIVASAARIDPTYSPQYFVSIGQNVEQAGGVQGSSGWYAPNSSVIASASSTEGWKFEMWTGSAGSFNESSVSLSVTGPINETAVFYPALSLTPAAGGQVTYKYGSVSGNAPGGSTTTIYLPPGSNVSLTAASSSTFYSPGSWSTGNSSTSGSSLDLAVGAPVSVSVSFELDITLIALIAAIIIGVIGSVAFVMIRRNGGRDFGDASTHTWKW